MNFSTKGMSLRQRYEVLEVVDLIPIGTICFRAGDFATDTQKIIVTRENQESVTMFWNSLYFLEKEKADEVTLQERIDYNNFQVNCMMNACIGGI